MGALKDNKKMKAYHKKVTDETLATQTLCYQTYLKTFSSANCCDDMSAFRTILVPDMSPHLYVASAQLREFLLNTCLLITCKTLEF